MDHLMYDVGTPITGQISRYICVYFRPAQSTDTDVLKIQYGNGCNAMVWENKKNQNSNKI